MLYTLPWPPAREGAERWVDGERLQPQSRRFICMLNGPQEPPCGGAKPVLWDSACARQVCQMRVNDREIWADVLSETTTYCPFTPKDAHAYVLLNCAHGDWHVNPALLQVKIGMLAPSPPEDMVIPRRYTEPAYGDRCAFLKDTAC